MCAALAFRGEAAELFADIGVAGLWRLTERLEALRRHRVVIDAAGMEGALFSVVGGLVGGLVVALPTGQGYGVSAGGLVRVGSKDDIRFQATAGNGLGRYAALNFVTGGVLTPDDRIEAIPSVLGFAGYRHHWSSRLRTNLNLAGILADPDAAFTGGAIGTDR